MVMMASHAATLTVCIVNHWHRKLIQRCLESIGRQADGVDVHVVVLDNASGDGSVEYLRQVPGITLIENERARGFAENQNRMLRIASGESRYVMMLNDDTVVEPDCLARLVSFMDAQPRAGAVAAQLLWPDGRLQASGGSFPSVWRELWRHSGLNALTRSEALRRALARRARALPQEVAGYLSHWRAAGPWEADTLCGGALLMRGETLRDVGLLDEGYPMYMEDVDWCRRARQRGWRLFVEPRARVVHDAGASSSVRTAVAWERSALRYYSIYHGWPMVWLLRAGLLVVSAARLLLAPISGLCALAVPAWRDGVRRRWQISVAVVSVALGPVDVTRRIPE
jgi:hypothetical protein